MSDFGGFTFSPPRYALDALAGMFHQDFDLHEVSVRQALDAQVGLMEAEEAALLKRQLQTALSKHPDRESFERYFADLGAEYWLGADIREEMVALLQRL